MADNLRKGARSIDEIPIDISYKLNHGELETVNLVEFLGIDSRFLLETVLTQYNRINYLQPILEQLKNLKKRTFVTINETIGKGLYEQSNNNGDTEFLTLISTYKTDLVRSWATVIIGSDSKLNIEQTLECIRPFAADKHFNVRECAWGAIRH